MLLKHRAVVFLIPLLLITLPAGSQVKKGKKALPAEVGDTASGSLSGGDVLWREPASIASRNLFYGPGGPEHQPRGRFTFVEEDLEGTNPKFVVQDEDGVKWKVKLGLEARPETAASRLLWSVGYFANEDYFVADLQVDHMPERLHRGQDFVLPGGVVHDVRMKRQIKGEKKIGEWTWENSLFSGTREWNGLRVMMALINNWDLKDENNAVYENKLENGGVERIYMVSDLGASFGTGRLTWPLAHSKGDLETYRNSKFIESSTPRYFNFATPAGASLPVILRPHEYKLRKRLEWIGKDVPREDVQWIGRLLAQVTPEQIADAFRAAGYPFDKINGFVAVVVSRIESIDSL
jgi:hypothetical protein